MPKVTEQNKKYSLSSGTLLAILLVAYLGLDFLNLPDQAVESVGASGYWTIIIAFILVLPIIYIISDFQRRFPERNLISAAPLVIGKPLAFLGNLLFLSIIWGWLILSIRDAADLVLTYMLDRTPLWISVFLFLMGIGYIAMKGLDAVGRIASFVLIPTVCFRIGMQILAFQDFSLSHVLPLITARPLNYLMGGIKLTNAFFSILTIILIYHFLDQPKKISAISLGVSGCALLVYMIEIVGTVGVFGATYTQRFAWSNLALIQRINIPYLVLEQVGPLFLVVWLTMFLVSTAFYFTLLGNGITQIFPKLDYKMIILGLLPIVGIIGVFFSNNSAVSRWFHIFREWAMLPVVGYPLLVYIIALIRRVRRNI
jgi:spore germination protein